MSIENNQNLGVKLEKFISITLERQCLSSLFKFPEIFPEIENFITEDCFNDADGVHRAIFAIIKKNYNEKGIDEKLSKVLVAEQLKNINIKFKGELDIYSYLDSCITEINKNGALDSFKELLKRKVAIDLAKNAKEEYVFVRDNLDKPIQEIIEGVDQIHNNHIQSLQVCNSQPKDIFEDLEEFIEDIGNNPPDESKFMMGPIDTMNRIYGSLHREGNITVVGARTGTGKTSFGMFENIHVAEKYNIPIYHLDNGEMSELELKFRATCMFTKGVVPYIALERGYWRNNKIWTEEVRKIWPRVKKIKMYLGDVSRLKPNEVISLIRRFAYNTVGRGNKFLVHYDYLKPFDTTNYNLPEWKEMGHFIQDMKSFITNELPVPFWASLQLNRQGITNNKNSSQLDDSEGSFGISDRIAQMSTHSILMRYKVLDEIALEQNRFGNLKAIFVKTRHLGEDYEDALTPVKVSKGKYMKNYVNLHTNSFYFEDRKDLNYMVKELGDKIDVSEDKEKEEDL